MQGADHRGWPHGCGFQTFCLRVCFNDLFFGTGLFGIKFQVQFLFHRPDDQETDPAGKDDAVWGNADQYLRPFGYLRQYLVKDQQQLGRAPFE
jgi:hypothetical protein